MFIFSWQPHAAPHSSWALTNKLTIPLGPFAMLGSLYYSFPCCQLSTPSPVVTHHLPQAPVTLIHPTKPTAIAQVTEEFHISSLVSHLKICLNFSCDLMLRFPHQRWCQVFFPSVFSPSSLQWGSRVWLPAIPSEDGLWRVQRGVRAICMHNLTLTASGISLFLPPINITLRDANVGALPVLWDYNLGIRQGLKTKE